MSLNNLGLGFVFTARDLASGAIQNLERNFLSLDRKVGLGAERIQSSFQQLGVGLAVFSAGAGMVAGAFSLANAAGRFEQSIAAVGAISGASALELQQLRDAAIGAGIATQFSPTEAVLGLRELAQAGFSAAESMALLSPVLDLAGGSLGELSPQQSAGLAAQAMKAFGLSVDEASVSVDRMLQAVNVFALNASELPTALGVASRGAQALHQSLSETLITLGLVKNVIPGVERASTAAAVAMERMADPEVQKKLRGIGVSVVDAHGSFRGFLDVVGEMSPRLERMSEAQRSAFLLSAFGREALGGLSAVMTQVTNGIRTNTGETLRGGAAIAYLRQQFDSAGGTAARFRDQMLNTFEGQKKLLGGSLETLAIVIGEPFAQVFKPIVSAVVEVVNGLLGVLRQLPAPVKKAFAGFAVAAGAVIATVGAVIAVKAGVALLAVGLKVLGVTAAGLMSTMLPAIATVALLGLVVAGFVYAVRNNLGGLGDFVHRLWGEGPSRVRCAGAALRAGGILRRRDGGARPRGELGPEALPHQRVPGGLPHRPRLGWSGRRLHDRARRGRARVRDPRLDTGRTRRGAPGALPCPHRKHREPAVRRVPQFRRAGRLRARGHREVDSGSDLRDRQLLHQPREGSDRRRAGVRRGLQPPLRLVRDRAQLPDRAGRVDSQRVREPLRRSHRPVSEGTHEVPPSGVPMARPPAALDRGAAATHVGSTEQHAVARPGVITDAGTSRSALEDHRTRAAPSGLLGSHNRHQFFAPDQRERSGRR